MRNTRHLVLAAVLVAGLFLVGALASGCTTAAPDSGGTAETSSAVETTGIATPAEVRELVAHFYQPEAQGDPGYDLLGSEHNDYSAWTRSVILAYTDYGKLTHSFASQQAEVPTDALDNFDKRIKSVGATETYDAVITSEMRLEATVTEEDKQLAELVPASTVLALLFNRQGHLDGYTPKSVAVDGTVANLTYAKAGAPDVTLSLEIERRPDKSLVFAGVRDYAQFEQVFIDTEFGTLLP